MAQIIINETPSWVIDWLNKVYTTAYPIQQVISLTVDWLDYLSFSFSGSTLTLTDSPTVSIFVDYLWTWPWDNSWSSVSTLSDLRDMTRNLYLRIDPNWKIRNNSVLDQLINRAYIQVQKDWMDSRKQQQHEYSFSTIGWDNSYSLPSDFLKMSLVKREQQIINPTTKEQVYHLSSSVWSPVSYYIYNWVLSFYPSPSGSVPVSFLYNKRLPTITSAQNSQLTTDFDYAIACYAAYLWCGGVEKDSKAQRLYSEYQNTISMLKYQYLVTDYVYTYSNNRNAQRNLLGPKQA